MLHKLKHMHEDPTRLRREFLEWHSTVPVHERKPLAFTGNETESQILTLALAAHNGIIFGERHFSSACIGFLIEQMGHLASLGVRYFFFEGLYHGYERGLDGTRAITDSVHDEYQRLIQAALQYNIDVIGIDHVGAKRGEGVTRDIFMNAHAASVMTQYSLGHKWIALVGMMHVNDTVFIDPASLQRFAVRGLAELTGGVGIIIDTVGNAKPYIHTNTHFAATAIKHVRADVVLGIAGYNRTSQQHPPQDSYQPMHELCTFIQTIGGQLTHYDVDSFAKGTLERGYSRGIILTFTHPNFTPRTYEQLKYQIKARVPIQPNEPFPYQQWLDIHYLPASQELLLCCNAGRVDELVAAMKTVMGELVELGIRN